MSVLGIEPRFSIEEQLKLLTRDISSSPRKTLSKQKPIMCTHSHESQHKTDGQACLHRPLCAFLQRPGATFDTEHVDSLVQAESYGSDHQVYFKKTTQGISISHLAHVEMSISYIA